MDDIKHGAPSAASPLDARLRLMRLADTQLQFAEPGADVRGHRVMDSNKRKIGYVRGLMVDETAPKVYFLEVAFGGLLGWGESAFLIPVEAIVRLEKHLVFIDQVCARHMNAIRYQPVLQDPLPEENVNAADYYGYPPYGQL